MSDLRAILAERDSWLEVLARGDDDEVRDDATSRLRRCRTALEEVGARLAAIGYPVQPIVRDLPVDAQELRSSLTDGGVDVPPLLALCWEIVGACSVLDLRRYAHVAFWSGRGVGYAGAGAAEACDGLHIDSPEEHDVEAYVGYVADEHEAWIDSGAGSDGVPFEFPLAPDGLHKDDISGGDPYGLALGTSSWDHRVTNFEWRGEPASAPPGSPDLLSYLRTAILECGCFPGFFGSATFEPDRRYLVADLPTF